MPDDLLNQIDAKANQEMLSRSDIIRKALLFYFKHENSVK
ncbi:MAG: CopG family transcriptional regulator [Gloeotrichia echinulata DVL01]